jgi:phosphoglycolate phosphatase
VWFRNASDYSCNKKWGTGKPFQPYRHPKLWESSIKADAYFFDIDGTLLVTRDLVHWNALRQAMLEVYGSETTIEGISYHGKTDVAILKAALNRSGISDLVFYQQLPAALSVVCREVSCNLSGLQPDVCPSVPRLLSQIQDLKKMLGIASGNLETVGWHKLSAASIRDFFSFGSFGDQFELRTDIFDYAVSAAKSQLGQSASICFVGDTPDDVLAARNVNAQVIAVATGTFGLRELAKFNPDLSCQSCEELIGRLQ